MRRALQNTALVLFGFGLALVSLEIALQAAGLVLRTFGQRARQAIAESERTILCLGDSHTYGTAVPDRGSYPAQLEGYLNRSDPGARYAVINGGVPGMNSAQLAALLPDLIRSTAPNLVVVWVGLNNWWNLDDPANVRGTPREPGVSALLSRSRLFRLWLALSAERSLASIPTNRAEFQSRFAVTSRAWASAEFPPEAEFLATTDRDLQRIAEVLTDAEVPWILVTYPLMHGDFAHLHRRSAAGVAERFDVPLVDTSEDLARARADFPHAILICELSTVAALAALDEACLFADAMGPHPTATLYTYIAESIGRQALASLGCAGPCEPQRAAPRPRASAGPR